MKYENRQPTEGINVSKESPVKQFIVLSIGALIIVGVLFLAFTFLGGWLARFVPFSAEVSVMESLGIDFEEQFDSDSNELEFLKRKRELNDLASRIMEHMDVPDDMNITVHYVDDDVFNAFATLGGQVFFYRGLIEQMPHENALALVMAHEIAHELHRDPISGLGGGVAAKVALASVFGASSPVSPVLDITQIIGSANFTRSMETRADATAIAAVNGLYGHIAGADSLFRLLAKQSGDADETPSWSSTFLRTHPLDQDRIDAIQLAAEQNGWLMEGEATPLTNALAELGATAAAID